MVTSHSFPLVYSTVKYTSSSPFTMPPPIITSTNSTMPPPNPTSPHDDFRHKSSFAIMVIILETVAFLCFISFVAYLILKLHRRTSSTRAAKQDASTSVPPVAGNSRECGPTLELSSIEEQGTKPSPKLPHLPRESIFVSTRFSVRSNSVNTVEHSESQDKSFKTPRGWV